MKTIVLCFGALYGLLSIVFGAFGAHALKKVLSPEKLDSFEVGVRYQMYHALFLLIIGLYFQFSNGMEKSIAWLAIVGVLLFSGSIYFLAFSEQIKIPTKILGPVTPIGGLLMILAWGLLLVYFIRGNI